MDQNEASVARRAVEALRSGVPNRDVVSQLGVFQGDITQKFGELARELREESDLIEDKPRSIIVSGGFGAGKSHILEYLRHLALENNFVCSQVVISKETPLSDPVKLIRSAVETATLKDMSGRAVPEVLTRLNIKSESFARLFQWAHEQPHFDTRIAPLIKVLDELPLGSEHLVDRIADEWSGYPMKVPEIRQSLSEIGQKGAYRVGKTRLQDFGWQLWRFLPRLFIAAGYSGWVVLIDEVELILRYSKLQRAKSYAMIARLAGVSKAFNVFGLLPVFSVSNDYWTLAEERLRDSDIPNWLRWRGKPGDGELAKDVEAGIKVLQRALPLRPARPDELDELKERIRQLHSAAFGWHAPPASARETLASDSVREHVKSWIAEWDLRLLYPDYSPEIVAEEVKQDYSEDPDLEEPRSIPEAFGE